MLQRSPLPSEERMSGGESMQNVTMIEMNHSTADRKRAGGVTVQ